MNPTIALVSLLVAFGLATTLTYCVRRYALARRMLDVPNERSSHTVPTPRGGGVSIVVVGLAAVLGGAMAGWLPGDSALALAGSVVVAAAGLIDDRAGLAARWRLIAQLLAAAWAVAWLAPLPSLPLLGVGVPWGLPYAVLALVFIVWLTNLYNFMDGIDALAWVEAVTVAVPSALFLAQAGAFGTALVVAIFAAAALGFGLWNLHPAKIFMGDGGSGFIGFCFAGLALATHASGTLTLWAWLILLGVFIVDATVTLLRRMIAGQPWYRAHRDHAYQHAARERGSHGVVAAAVAVVNLAWLTPLAAGAAYAPEWGALFLTVAWAPLLALVFYYQAGRAQ